MLGLIAFMEKYCLLIEVLLAVALVIGTAIFLI